MECYRCLKLKIVGCRSTQRHLAFITELSICQYATNIFILKSECVKLGNTFYSNYIRTDSERSFYYRNGFCSLPLQPLNIAKMREIASTFFLISGVTHPLRAVTHDPGTVLHFGGWWWPPYKTFDFPIQLTTNWKIRNGHFCYVCRRRLIYLLYSASCFFKIVAVIETLFSICWGIATSSLAT